MDNSTTEKLKSGLSPEQQSIGVLTKLIETEYPDEDTNDIPNLCRLLNQEFGTSYSESEVIDYFVVSMQEEDNRLQYKHLNIKV